MNNLEYSITLIQNVLDKDMSVLVGIGISILVGMVIKKICTI